MRNLKRALSLALATVMTMGLMMVGTGASYKDVKTSDNVEAIEVLQTVGIMTGDENGNFNPDKTVTRNEMAVIMANLLNLDYDYYRGTNPFTDVPSWAAPYVAACAAEGVVSGIGNNMYGGEGNVTAAQASLMIMKALGYFQYQADFGDDWQIATIRQASYIDLFAGINATAETALTRNQIAQLVLNGLKANMVSFTGDVGTEATIGNTTINIGYRAEYTAKTNANSKYNSIDVGTTNIAQNDQYYVQLGEELYNGDLKLKNSTDVFGRPARYWEYDGKEIGTYAKYDLMVQEYTTKVTGKDLYDLLTASTIKDYTTTVYVDGETDSTVLGSAYFTDKNMIKTNTEGVGATGNGVLTQVFVDTQAKEITIAIINTYLAIADDDYDEKKDEVSFEVWGIDESSVKGAYVKNTAETETLPAVSGEDFDIEDIVDGDVVRVTVADGEIQTIDAVEMIEEATITKFTKGKNITADGTQYNYASTAMYDDEVLDQYDADNMKEQTYNVYLDQYGYLLGVKIVDKVSQYLFVTGMNGGSDNLANKKGSANVIFLDGTMATVDVNLTKSDVGANALANTWCKYSVDKNDTYTLTVVKSSSFDSDKDKAGQSKLQDNTDITLGTSADYIKTIDKKNTTLPGDGDLNVVYGNDASVYITVSTTEINTTAPGGLAVVVDDVETVSTGIRNVSLKAYAAEKAVDETDDVNSASRYAATASSPVVAYEDYVTSGVYTLFNDDGYVIAAIVVGEDDGTSSNFVYVTSKDGKDGLNYEGYDATTEDYTWTRTVIINGEEVELTEVTDTDPWLATMEQNEWYEVKYYADGNVRGVSKLNFTANANDKYEEDIEKIEDALNGNGSYGNYDTVLLFDDMTSAPYSLSCKGDTFFATSTTESGFVVAPDANIVLVQDKKVASTGKITAMDDIQYFDNGVDGIEKAFKRMNDNANFLGYISAVFEDGVATSVIIYDRTATLVEDGGIDQNADYVTKATVDEDNFRITVKALPTATDKTAAVVKALQNAGYTDISVGSGTAVGYKDSVRYNFSVTTYSAYKVTFDMGTTAAGYGNSIAKNKVVYMAEGDSVIVTMNQGGWNNDGLTLSITGTNLSIAKDGDKTVKVTADPGFNATVASAVIDFTL